VGVVKRLEAPGGGPMALWLVGRIVIVVVGFFFCGYGAWSGFGNFIGVQNERLQLGLDLTVLGWASTVTLVVLPVAIFIACLIITRRMRLPQMAFTFALAITLMSVITLDIVLALPQTAIFAT
jgi:hypothetical protein